MLPRKNRLQPKQFKQVFNQGTKYRGEYGMLIVYESGKEESKIAFVVSKKIGNAVQRHRMTRILRDISKKSIENSKGFNIIYVAYKYCDEYEKLQKDFNRQFEYTIPTTKKN